MVRIQNFLADFDTLPAERIQENIRNTFTQLPENDTATNSTAVQRRADNRRAKGQFQKIGSTRAGALFQPSSIGQNNRALMRTSMVTDDLFSSTIQGRALGGAVNAQDNIFRDDQSHMVGLQGPELFIPAKDGVIIPNHKLKSPLDQNIQARAVGGPVSSGSRYLVGEKGPEAFVPKINTETATTTGTVIHNHNNHQTYNIHMHVAPDVDGRSIAEQIRAELARHERAQRAEQKRKFQ